MKDVSGALSRVPTSDLGPPEPIEPIFTADEPRTMATWQAKRQELARRWAAVLGQPATTVFARTAEEVGRVRGPGWTGTLWRQPTGPETRQLVLVMEPEVPARIPRPVAVVPFYHPDAMAGLDLTTGQPLRERPVVQFGRHLVQQGYVVACPEAFPFNTVPEPESNVGFAWWDAAARELLAENPRWTGIAKLAADTSRALDLLLDLPQTDPERVLVMGHSLGGKTAFYAAAMDPRFKAMIGSDFGIGFSFTNWDAPWYLGTQIRQPHFTLGHHQLLALLAPRAFLLLGGEADRPASWQYLEEARQVYALYGREEDLGFLYHGAGHAPTEDALRQGYRWLAEQLELPERAWEL